MGKPRFNWEYCECGCKGSTVTVAGINFWEHQYLYEGRPFNHCLVVGGHGLGHTQGCSSHYDTIDELEDYVSRVVAQEKNGEAMANDNCLAGIACPKCKSEGPFDIECKTTFTVDDDGTDEYGDVDWEDSSACSCKKCHYEGIVMYFTISNPHFGVH